MFLGVTIKPNEKQEIKLIAIIMIYILYYTISLTSTQKSEKCNSTQDWTYHKIYKSLKNSLSRLYQKSIFIIYAKKKYLLEKIFVWFIISELMISISKILIKWTPALRYAFSLKTAVGLEWSGKLKLFPEATLTTAWFTRH